MKYDVAPFSGKNYARNEKRCGEGEEPCAICGKPVRGERFIAVVVSGGAEWGDVNSDSRDPGYMGVHPIGSDCHRKHVVRETIRVSGSAIESLKELRSERDEIARRIRNDEGTMSLDDWLANARDLASMVLADSELDRAVERSYERVAPGDAAPAEREDHASYGMRLARLMFKRRARNGRVGSEIHIGADELAAALAVAHEAGYKRGALDYKHPCVKHPDDEPEDFAVAPGIVLKTEKRKTESRGEMGGALDREDSVRAQLGALIEQSTELNKLTRKVTRGPRSRRVKR
jgi:hypothetical protein